jgi:archaellum component FlaF (FlaF/FlaG flagellin family)
MENSIPAIIIAGVLIISAAVLGNVTNRSVNSVGDAWRDMEAVSEERLGTDLAPVSANLDQTGQVVTLVLENNGRTSISNFDHMDVIANYDGLTGRYSTWLSYTELALQPDNSWRVTGIANDNKNPGILDSGEQLTINVQLAPTVTGPANRWLSLATETGVSYSVTF